MSCSRRKDDFIYDVVKKAIRSKRIVVFTKTNCPYCKRTDSLFRKTLDRKHYENDFDLLNVTGSRYEDELMDTFKKMTGARTVPRVFIDGKCIGGYDETKKLYDSGKLQRMLYK